MAEGSYRKKEIFLAQHTTKKAELPGENIWPTGEMYSEGSWRGS